MAALFSGSVFPQFDLTFCTKESLLFISGVPKRGWDSLVFMSPVERIAISSVPPVSHHIGFLRIGSLLLTVYLLAWVLPWSFWFGVQSSDSARWISRMLLAILLVLGSFGESKVIDVRGVSARTLAGALLMIWLSSIAGWTVATGLLEITQVPNRDAIRTGLLVIAIMPVASATLAWAHLSHADRSLSIRLLLLSSILTPIVSMGIALSTGDGLVWNRDAMVFLIVWVVLPTSVGIFLCRVSGVAARKHADHVSRRLSLPILLMLNYINASQCLPHVPWNQISVLGTLAMVIVFQGAILMAFTFLNRLMSIWHPLSVAQQRSAGLATILKNTGAAMVFIDSIATDASLIMLPILFSTLTQHLYASQMCHDGTMFLRETLTPDSPAIELHRSQSQGPS